MGHEIRTPMNGILGFSELLKEPMLSGEQQKEYIEIIEKSGARMLNIINDIISISKIESGESTLSVSLTNINELIENLVSFFSPEAEQKKIKIRFLHYLPVHEAVIRTDKEKVTSILTNLIKNAIKFTETGSIEVGYIKKEDYLEFFVKDTGTGVPEDLKENIFERFRQGSESLIRNYEGAGLGLSISKGYVDVLGGKIWVESNPKEPLTGKLNSENGSTFYFTLPVDSGNKEKTAINKIPANDVKERIIKNPKILIVEDDRISEFLISIISKKISNNILKVANGTDAIRIFQNNPDIDLVLMDIKLPGMDGYEATRQIRKFNKNVIIIAQTAYVLEGDREKAIAAGCNDYISKPINVIKLKEMILKHLKINKTALIEELK
jgi:CheY-like chemotaxis protein